jgi:DNA (cytosine-5)-methyltransferase 1
MKNHPQSSVSQSTPTCIEICSGAGGQALGLERAGFEAMAHVEFDRQACETLRLNRPDWNVVEGDVRDFSAKEFKGVDLLAVSLNRTIPEPKGKVVYA